MTQKMLSFVIFLLLLAGCRSEPAEPTAPAALPTETSAPADVIHICDDGSEWPPYSYYERVNGEKTDKVVGFMVDVVDEIFGKNGVAYTVELLPWQRCQDEVKRGENYQMLLNASYNEERAQNYHMSQVAYVTNSYYFYSKQNYSAGLEVKDKADLKNFRVCGILGYNYDEYDVPEIDTGTADMTALIEKLHAGRCDLFIEKLEIMSGFTVMGNDILGSGQLGYAPIVGTEPAPFYLMFTKNEQGLELKNIIDTGLQELTASGRFNELLKKYVP